MQVHRHPGYGSIDDQLVVDWDDQTDEGEQKTAVVVGVGSLS